MAQPDTAVPVTVLAQVGFALGRHKSELPAVQIQAGTGQRVDVLNGIGDAVVLQRRALVGLFQQLGFNPTTTGKVLDQRVCDRLGLAHVGDGVGIGNVGQRHHVVTHPNAVGVVGQRGAKGHFPADHGIAQLAFQAHIQPSFGRQVGRGDWRGSR